jgi:Clp amino terminal domain, pathogenicity island component
MEDLPSVASLAAGIDDELAAGSSLERLGAAVAVAVELRELGDLVVDRYVEAARADARSWSQIGEVLGVTKQAAQQRFVGHPVQASPWPGLSEAATAVVGRAVDEARALGHRYLGTEHLLLALAQDDGLAGATLVRLGVSSESVREQIHRIIGPGHSAESATLGITPRTKRVLETARKEARRLGHRCADTEHVLLAVGEGDAVAGQILRELGADPAAVRAQLADLLEGEAPELAAKLRTPARRRLRRSRA